jgi:hypothetical protein
MNGLTLKIAGMVLIAAGIMGLVYGSFSFTKETREAKIRSIELSGKDGQTVNMPVWEGIGPIVIGSALLVIGGMRSGASPTHESPTPSGNP